MERPDNNRDLLLPYLLPYLMYVLPGVVLGDGSQREIIYLLRLILCGGALVWGWRRYAPISRAGATLGSIGIGFAAGLIGTVLWIALLMPFVGAGGEPWDERSWALRLLVAATLPPLFEELFLRGYVLGVATQWDRLRRAGRKDAFAQALDHDSIRTLDPGAWTWVAIGISTLLFTLGHTEAEWLAAFAYGLLMCGLWIVRKDLVSCMTAHAVTNIALGLYVRASGHWTLW
ncbi:MAG: CPBP family intramembrane metalloprotease [bacterium]|nr:CPBP family intramembrane metalloprotease [bacterium]